MTTYTDVAHPELQASLEHGVLVLAINRPKAKNALYSELYHAICDALIAAEEDDQIKAVVLRGAEDDFSAGNDMGDFIKFFEYDLEKIKAGDLPPFRLLKTVAGFGKPIILAIKGAAIGIGVTLLLHVDMAYADDTAVFQMPFLGLGVTPEGAATQLMVERIGYVETCELLYTAQKFDRQKAEKLGLINALPDGADVYDYAYSQAQKIANMPHKTVRQTKQLLKHDLGRIIQCIDDEAEIFMRHVQSPECKEAVLAFKEKRKPNFNQ